MEKRKGVNEVWIIYRSSKTEQQHQQKAAQGNLVAGEGGLLYFFHDGLTSLHRVFRPIAPNPRRKDLKRSGESALEKGWGAGVSPSPQTSSE